MIKTILAFTVGAASGVAASYLYLKNHYEQWAQKEINTMREYYKDKNTSQESTQEDSETTIDSLEELPEEKGVANDKNTVPDMMEYARKLNSSGYVNYSENNFTKDILKEEDKTMFDKPYIIQPDEFGEFYDYDTVSLTYHADGVIVDENYEVIDDISEIIVPDFVNHFGDYDDDVVFVRNDRLKCDYEILRDLEPFE